MFSSLAAIATPCDPPPRVENAIVVASYQKKYLPGSPVTYQCRDKFTLEDGEDTIQCKDGTWETKNIQCTRTHSISKSIRQHNCYSC